MILTCIFELIHNFPNYVITAMSRVATGQRKSSSHGTSHGEAPCVITILTETGTTVTSLLPKTTHTYHPLHRATANLQTGINQQIQH